VRYWVDGEDENYDRELARIRRFGGAQPAPVSPSNLAGLVLLVGIQAFLFASVIVGFVLWLQ
jgi:hypothetical protein